MTNKLATNGRELSERHKIWLCDIWGVVHNGVAAHQAACNALEKHRQNDGIVILITNAPRPKHAVITQLEGLKVSENCYDDIVTSGDVTRELVMAYSGQKVFFLGPERDFALKEGLDVEWSGVEEADGVLCSGLYNDKEDQPEDYSELFEKMLSRNLSMICANPDVVVQFGDRLIPCAGALAKYYKEMGGTVDMAGKPFAPIYDVSMNRVAGLAGCEINRADVLALGDGMNTDIAGARDNNFPVAFITGGIHDEEIGTQGSVEDMANIARKAITGINVSGAMRTLEW